MKNNLIYNSQFCSTAMPFFFYYFIVIRQENCKFLLMTEFDKPEFEFNCFQINWIVLFGFWP